MPFHIQVRASPCYSQHFCDGSLYMVTKVLKNDDMRAFTTAETKKCNYLIFLLCVQIGCTCGDYLCGEVKTQLRMCQRIGNMPKVCSYDMAMSVFEILDYEF